MKSVRAKLHSSSGASMAFALIFLLLCLMVGAVVLTAAASNVGRISHARANEQDYFTVSSAARLLRDRLEDFQYGTGEEQVSDSGPGGGTTAYYLNPIPAADSLTGLVESLAEQVFRTQPDYASPPGSMPGDESLVITDAGSVFDEVTATLSMDADYDITIAFALTDSPDSYALTLTIPADVIDETSSSSAPYYVEETEYVEGVPTTVTYTYYITTTTRTVTVTWSGGVISKGG